MQKAPSKIIDWALNAPLEYQQYQKLLCRNKYARKSKHLQKMKSKYYNKGVVPCKSMRKLIWSNS